MHRLVPARIRLIIAVVSVIGLSIAAPAASLASCVPPQLRTFADEPGAVVVAGTVRQTDPQRVAIDVQLWWGADPEPSVVILRPATDPTVISSTDWNPTPGEQWVVLARREGDALRTAVCDQMPATALSVGEVESSLGAGKVPTAPDPIAGETVTETGLPAWTPIVVGGVLLALAAASVVALSRRRHAAGAVDPAKSRRRT